MGIRQSFDIRKFVIISYFSSLFVYVIFGFMPAGAKNYDISGKVSIPAINMFSEVTSLELEGRKLETPDYIVGSYSNAENKTLLIGHRSTIFNKLDEVMIGDSIWFNGQEYIVSDSEIYEKANINMDQLLASEDENTLVVMTCAGKYLDASDATHRLIVTAKVL